MPEEKKELRLEEKLEILEKELVDLKDLRDFFEEEKTKLIKKEKIESKGNKFRRYCTERDYYGKLCEVEGIKLNQLGDKLNGYLQNFELSLKNLPRYVIARAGHYSKNIADVRVKIDESEKDIQEYREQHDLFGKKYEGLFVCETTELGLGVVHHDEATLKLTANSNS